MIRGVFLDRDGVINFDDGYTHKFKPIQIIPQIIDVIKYANHHNYKVVIVTNQSGIGRGLYTEVDFHKYMLDMITFLAGKNAIIEDYFFAPYFKNSLYKKYRLNENKRKPNIGMICAAQKKYNIDLSNSILIGDKITDIEAGMRSGIKHNILFDSCNLKTTKTKNFTVVSNLCEILTLPIW